MTLFPAETSVLQALLARQMSVRTDGLRLSGLDRPQQGAVSAAYFLLDAPAKGGVERFVTFTLARLIEQLGRETERPYVLTMGQVRGQVNWQATVKARYGDDYNPSRFICREVRRDYDTPQNQLLKAVVEAIHECLLAVPRVIRYGACYYPTDAPGKAAARTQAILDRMETAVSRARHHVSYAAISRPLSVTEEHRRAAILSREEMFVEVTDTWERYQAMHKPASRVDALQAAGRRALLLPAQPDGEGVLWLRLGAAILQGQIEP